MNSRKTLLLRLEQSHTHIAAERAAAATSSMLEKVPTDASMIIFQSVPSAD